MVSIFNVYSRQFYRLSYTTVFNFFKWGEISVNIRTKATKMPFIAWEFCSSQKSFAWKYVCRLLFSNQALDERWILDIWYASIVWIWDEGSGPTARYLPFENVDQPNHEINIWIFRFSIMILECHNNAFRIGACF